MKYLAAILCLAAHCAWAVSPQPAWIPYQHVDKMDGSITRGATVRALASFRDERGRPHRPELDISCTSHDDETNSVQPGWTLLIDIGTALAVESDDRQHSVRFRFDQMAPIMLSIGSVFPDDMLIFSDRFDRADAIDQYRTDAYQKLLKSGFEETDARRKSSNANAAQRDAETAWRAVGQARIDYGHNGPEADKATLQAAEAERKAEEAWLNTSSSPDSLITKAWAHMKAQESEKATVPWFAYPGPSNSSTSDPVPSGSEIMLPATLAALPDSLTAIFPALMNSKTLMVQFTAFPNDSTVTTFPISGLNEALKRAGCSEPPVGVFEIK